MTKHLSNPKWWSWRVPVYCLVFIIFAICAIESCHHNLTEHIFRRKSQGPPLPQPHPPRRLWGRVTSDITLAWDPSPSTNTIANYRVYWGPSSHTYSAYVNAGTNLSVTVPGLLRSGTYYFAATATDTMGRESDYSNELRCRVPVDKIVRVTLQTSTTNSGPWTDWQTIVRTNPADNYFYRTRATKSSGIWTLTPQQSASLTTPQWTTVPGWTNRTQNYRPYTRYQSTVTCE